jgi:hypothetical protein
LKIEKFQLQICNPSQTLRMSIDWQTAASLAIVAASVALLARRIARVFIQRSCGTGCGGCPAGRTAAKSAEFVPLENLERPLDSR